MKIDILTIFPSMFDGFLSNSIIKRAIAKGIVEINIIDIRPFSLDKNKRIDDYPIGGGAGLVMKCQPVLDALKSVRKDNSNVILMSPRGEKFNQKIAHELINDEHLVFICGHYEGFDERIRQHLVTDELSLGDYVLTGGELAAMVMTDAVVRLLPDVLGKQESHENDSFSMGLLEFPQYTRPVDFRGMMVPPVLTSGNHKEIEKWRHEQSLYRTYTRRPDLLESRELTDHEKKLIETFKQQSKS